MPRVVVLAEYLITIFELSNSNVKAQRGTVHGDRMPRTWAAVLQLAEEPRNLSTGNPSKSHLWFEELMTASKFGVPS